MSANAQALTERIALMFGRSTYRDARAGPLTFPVRNPGTDDIVGAVGVVRRKCGHLVTNVLETHFGSTLMHAGELCREWDRQNPLTDYAAITLSRFGSKLAVRRFAGAKPRQADIADFAWMLKTRRASLDEAIARTEAWLTHLLDVGARELIVAMRGTR
jgi:hypothetical protein